MNLCRADGAKIIYSTCLYSPSVWKCFLEHLFFYISFNEWMFLIIFYQRGFFFIPLRPWCQSVSLFIFHTFNFYSNSKVIQMKYHKLHKVEIHNELTLGKKWWGGFALNWPKSLCSNFHCLYLVYFCKRNKREGKGAKPLSLLYTGSNTSDL